MSAGMRGVAAEAGQRVGAGGDERAEEDQAELGVAARRGPAISSPAWRAGAVPVGRRGGVDVRGRRRRRWSPSTCVGRLLEVARRSGRRLVRGCRPRAPPARSSPARAAAPRSSVEARASPRRVGSNQSTPPGWPLVDHDLVAVERRRSTCSRAVPARCAERRRRRRTSDERRHGTARTRHVSAARRPRRRVVLAAPDRPPALPAASVGRRAGRRRRAPRRRVEHGRLGGAAPGRPSAQRPRDAGPAARPSSSTTSTTTTVMLSRPPPSLARRTSSRAASLRVGELAQDRGDARRRRPR